MWRQFFNRKKATFRDIIDSLMSFEVIVFNSTLAIKEIFVIKNYNFRNETIDVNVSLRQKSVQINLETIQTLFHSWKKRNRCHWMWIEISQQKIYLRRLTLAQHDVCDIKLPT